MTLLLEISFASCLNTALVVIGAVLLLLNLVPLLIWLERKGSAFIQDRLGPNRAVLQIGPMHFRLMGFVHNFADTIKLLFKEDLIPEKANAFYYVLAPFLAGFAAFVTFAVIPFASPDLFSAIHFQALRLDAGVLWVAAFASFSTFAVMLGGWASHNKFGLLGALRVGAQMISYELTLLTSLLGMILIAGSAEPQAIVKYQDAPLCAWLPIPNWGVLLQPLAFLLFLTCIFAETNRNPFDMPEGESELVAGYHVEYSSMKFALFFMAEYLNMAVGSMLIATLFFGGWAVPFADTTFLKSRPDAAGTFMGLAGALVFALLAFAFFRLYKKRREKPYFRDIRDEEPLYLGVFCLLASGALLVAGLSALLIPLSWWPTWLGPAIVAMFQLGWLLIKTLFFLWLFIWVRWTLPRFRYDQVMALGWKVLFPLALLNLAGTALVLAWLDG